MDKLDEIAFKKGLRRIDEKGVNRILSHGEHGFVIVSSNGLDGRLSVLLSASNQHASNHPSISGQSRLVLSISSELPNLAKDVVIETRSAQELSSLLSVDLQSQKEPRIQVPYHPHHNRRYQRFY